MDAGCVCGVLANAYSDKFVGDATVDGTQDLTTIDHEELNAGYQAAYTRLAASESRPIDVVGWVGPDLVGYVKKTFTDRANSNGVVQQQLLSAAGQSPIVKQALQ